MRVVNQSRGRLELSDSDRLFHMLMVAGLLLLSAGPAILAERYRERTIDREVVAGSAVASLVGLAIVLSQSKRTCIIDQAKGVIVVRRKRLMGTRSTKFALGDLKGLRLVERSDSEESWLDLELVRADDSIGMLGRCSEERDGWGSGEELREALSAMGLLLDAETALPLAQGK